MKTDITYLNEYEQQIIQIFLQRIQMEKMEKVVDVFLFGSRARGDANFDSDLDLAVIVEKVDLTTRNTIRDIATEIWLENGLYISTRVWSQTHWKRLQELKTGLYRNIQREGIDVLQIFA